MIFFLLFISTFLTESPILWNEGKEIDLGVLTMKDTKNVVFNFTNTSDRNLVVQTVRTSCGCTGTTWTETPVAPEGKGEINVRFKPNSTGYFRKKLTVYFYKVKKPEILWISGETE
jgi:hypothetical protein